MTKKRRKKLDGLRAKLAAEAPSALRMRRLEVECRRLRAELKDAHNEQETLRARVEHIIDLVSHDADPEPVKAKHGKGQLEGTVYIQASDWHAGETVVPASVNDLNEYSVPTFKRRAAEFWRAAVWYVRGVKKLGYHVDNVVLGVLGDLITGYLHDDQVQGNILSPTEESLLVIAELRRGIAYLTASLPKSVKFTVPCLVGNHGRTTKKMMAARATQNSYEWLAYRVLADEYKDDPRVSFIVPESEMVYLDVYDYTVRLHHGHRIRYWGGNATLAAPAAKMVQRWNKGRHADYTHCGHYHQHLDGPNYAFGGSLMGANAYGANMGGWEPPTQYACLYDRDYGKRLVTALSVDDRYTLRRHVRRLRRG